MKLFGLVIKNSSDNSIQRMTGTATQIANACFDKNSSMNAILIDTLSAPETPAQGGKSSTLRFRDGSKVIEIT